MSQPMSDRGCFSYHPHHHVVPNLHQPQHDQYHHLHHQLQLPPQFRNCLELLFDERTGAINCNYVRPYLPESTSKQDASISMATAATKRPRRRRTRFNKGQVAALEQHFLQGRYLSSSRLAELSASLSLGTAQIKVWFKNRRRRQKLQSSQQHDCSSSNGSGTSVLSPETSPETATNTGGSPTDPVQPLSGAITRGHHHVDLANILTPLHTPTTPTTTTMADYNDTYNPFYYADAHLSAYATPLRPTAVQQTLTNGSTDAHYQYQAASTSDPALVATGKFFTPMVDATQSFYKQPHYGYQYKAPDCDRAVDNLDCNHNKTPVGTAATISTTLDTALAAPSSDLYEPLTPNNDDSPILCHGDDDTKDQKDDWTARTLQILNHNITNIRKELDANDKINNISTKSEAGALKNTGPCTTMVAMSHPYGGANIANNNQFAFCFD